LSFNLIILISLISIYGCGVKSDPKKYPEVSVPSYLGQFEKEEHSSKPKPK